MKSLKRLGVLIFGFMFLGLNVNALEISEDYTLKDNSSEQIVVKENSNVTINLNGKKLTTTTDGITVNKGAKVTITGNGEVESSGAAILNKEGTVTIENGTFTSTKWYTIKNLGTIIVNGGTFTQGTGNSSNACLVDNGWVNGSGTDANDKGVTPPEKTSTEAKAIMTINGGTFIHPTATTSTIKSDDWSKTTINGGKFTSNNGFLIQVTGEVIVKDGEFIGYNSVAVFNGNSIKGFGPADLTINGGKFNAKSIMSTDSKGTLTITGGTFDGITEFTNSNKNKFDYTKNITGGTYAIDVTNVIDSNNAKVEKENGKYVVYTKQCILTKGDETGTVIFNKEEAFPGEEITMTITASKGYVLDSIKVTDDNGKTVEVKDNKFIMPNLDVHVDVIFKAEQTVNIPSVSKESGVSVNNSNEVQNILLESLKQTKKYDNDSISLQIVVEDIKTDEKTNEEFESALEDNKINNGKIVSYFDISIAIKNTITNEQLGNLTELTKKIKFTVQLPAGLESVKEGYTRNFYIIKKHGDKTTVLKGTLTEDGKSIEFETDEFSTYALAYEDVEVDSSTTNTEVVPQTFDGIGSILLFSMVAVISVLGITLYFKRELENK